MNFGPIGRAGLLGAMAPLAVFAQNPEILVNAQGLAQRDYSIRGSSYAGAGVSLNGLVLEVPWSRHFNADLPLPGYLLAVPEAQTGPGNAAGHLVGTAAYATVPHDHRLRAEAGIGTREHYRGALSAGAEGVGGFLEWEKARRIDYGANGLDRLAGGMLARGPWGGWAIEAVAARQEKEFGAQGYYGRPADRFADQRTADTLAYLGAARGDLDGAYLRAGAAWREFADQYRIPATGDGHDVRSRFGALSIEGRTLEIQHLALNLRGDLAHERIGGGIAGRDRTRGSLLLLPEARFERFAARAGVDAVFQSDEAAEWLPQAGIDWFATDNATLYAAYSEAVRQPDYQTLESNPRLPMQKAGTAEAGVRQFLSPRLQWRAAAFRRRLEGASDWIGGAATGLGTLHVLGAEAAAGYAHSEKLSVQAFYQWIRKDSDRTDGLYELDYPEHLLGFSGHWRFAPEFDLSTAQALRRQTANDARTGGEFGAEASLGLHYLPRCAKNARLSFLVENLWGTAFQAIPGLKPRPASFFAGMTVEW